MNYDFTSSIILFYILFLFFPQKYRTTVLTVVHIYFIVTYVKNPVRNWMTRENIFLSVLLDLSEIWYLFEPKIRLLFSCKKVLFTTYHFQFPAKTLNCFLQKRVGPFSIWRGSKIDHLVYNTRVKIKICKGVNACNNGNELFC